MNFCKPWLVLLLLSWALSAHAQDQVYGAELQGFDYPAPVQKFSFTSQQQSVHMACMLATRYALMFAESVNQPVVYEFALLKVPTLLLMGEKDNTAIGKDLVIAELKARMGLYPELARRTAKLIPNATLVLFPDLGHAPQMQNPLRFHTALVNNLLALQD